MDERRENARLHLCALLGSGPSGPGLGSSRLERCSVGLGGSCEGSCLLGSARLFGYFLLGL